jgi:hypothetical protein
MKRGVRAKWLGSATSMREARQLAQAVFPVVRPKYEAVAAQWKKLAAELKRMDAEEPLRGPSPIETPGVGRNPPRTSRYGVVSLGPIWNAAVIVAARSWRELLPINRTRVAAADQLARTRQPLIIVGDRYDRFTRILVRDGARDDPQFLGAFAVSRYGVEIVFDSRLPAP